MSSLQYSVSSALCRDISLSPRPALEAAELVSCVRTFEVSKYLLLLLFHSVQFIRVETGAARIEFYLWKLG